MPVNPEITVCLEGCEPMELMRNATSRNVWFRWKETEYWPLIEIKGIDEEVWGFIKDHWDEDVADQMVYNEGPLA
jgi:hypothetical protein